MACQQTVDTTEQEATAEGKELGKNTRPGYNTCLHADALTLLSPNLPCGFVFRGEGVI